MSSSRSKWGKKERCSCPLAKRKFSPRLDANGHRTGGGKCWSTSCGQRHFPDTIPHNGQRHESPPPDTVRHHVYISADGSRLLRITIRKTSDGDKRVFAEHWEGSTWIKGEGNISRVLYRLPEVLSQLANNGVIVVVEGEKDADSAAELGLVATCNPFGAGKWQASMSETLAGGDVVIIPDLDEPGWKHASIVKQSLVEAGANSVNILDLRTLMPDLPEKGDLSDYVSLGGNPDQLRKAIENACAITHVDASSSTVTAPPVINWDALPSHLNELARSVEDERQRIALLMAAITVIGSVIPGVTTKYNGWDYSPSLYLFVSGPPGSGKGSIAAAVNLIDEVDREIRAASHQALNAYDSEYTLWNSRKDKSGCPPPEKPVRKALRLSADSTGSVIIRATCNNPSVLVFDTEGDTLSVALRPDTIDASSALRKAWHHERIDQERVTDALHVVAERPHLSIVLSGTPNQITALVKHVESGLTSRICFIEFPPQKQFRNPFEVGADMVHLKARSLQKEIRQLWAFVRDQPRGATFQVTLTSAQQSRHVQHFRQRFEDDIEGADEAATLRAGIVAVRIITVLTAVREWFSQGKLLPNMVATDEDFDIGLELAEFLRKGTDAVIHRLSAQIKSTPLPHSKRNTQQWFDSLPDEFDNRLALETGKKLGIARSTVYSLLSKESYFERLRHGCYRKLDQVHSRSP